MGRPVTVEGSAGAAARDARYAAERDGGRRARRPVLGLVRTGAGVAAAGRPAGVGGRRAERWLGWDRRGGRAEGLRRVPGHGARGAPGRLTAAPQERLRGEARAGARRTDDEARRWVAAAFGVR